MGVPLRSVSLFTLRPPPPQISFFACYRGATSHFSFFTKFMGPPSDQFLRLLYGPRVTIGLVYLFTIYGVPSYQFLCILFGGPSQISFFSYYKCIRGYFRSVSSHTIWGAPQISFFAYYMVWYHFI